MQKVFDLIVKINLIDYSTCKVRWFIDFIVSDSNVDKQQAALPQIIKLPKTYPYYKSIQLPRYAPMPPCGYSFASVQYFLRGKKGKTDWKEPWLIHDK